MNRDCKHTLLRTVLPMFGIRKGRAAVDGIRAGYVVCITLLLLAVAPNLTAQSGLTLGNTSNTNLSSSSSSTSGMSGQSGLSGLLGDNSASELLDPEIAFVMNVVQHEDNTAVATFKIEEGYFLYRHRFNASTPDENVSAKITSLTPGKKKHDEFFGEVEINRNQAVAEIAFQHKGEPREVALDISYQGCADIGICFPPQTKRVSFTLASADTGDIVPGVVGSAAITDTPGPGTGSGLLSGDNTVASLANTAANGNSATSITNEAATGSTLGLSEQDRLANTLGQSSLPFIFLLFVGLGLLLAFTPCVLPMIPILSGLISGQNSDNMTTRKATGLSIVYVLVMATTYALAGVAIGLTGAGIGFLQNPWVLSAFAVLLVLMSLSMFGFYELQMPVALQNRLNRIGSSRKGGSVANVAFMGFLSALIVGPCVTAPLVGALIFIADTGDAVVGGTALFALGLGMGIPLVLVGASCGHFLPKAGAWMQQVKAFFGVMLLAMAIWMLSRFLPIQAILAMTAALAIVCGIYMGALDNLAPDSSNARRFAKGTGILTLLYGAALLFGALSSGNSLIYPLRNFALAPQQTVINESGTLVSTAAHKELDFVAVKSVDELDAFIKTAGQAGQPLILDFYADWCVSCKEMEAFTFTDPMVMEQMQKAMLLRADVTKNDKLDRELLKRFKLFGPPAILFFAPNGEETRNGRVVGFMNKEKFREHLVLVYNDIAQTMQAANLPSTESTGQARQITQAATF